MPHSPTTHRTADDTHNHEIQGRLGVISKPSALLIAVAVLPAVPASAGAKQVLALRGANLPAHGVLFQAHRSLTKAPTPGRRRSAYSGMCPNCLAVGMFPTYWQSILSTPDSIARAANAWVV